MKKQLPTDTISNELSESSVFFQPPASPKTKYPLSASEQPEDMPAPATKAHINEEITRRSPQKGRLPRNHATVIPRNRDTTVEHNHATTLSVNAEDTNGELMEELRKAVKQLGKEAATYRFTGQEKSALADIVYTYGRQGLRTSENEITRIAVNWLLMDYRENGGNSILARLLDSLHG